jgi:hypothetical protein
MTADINSTVSLRLRGSGLRAELNGEFVWFGPTQKEVGIRFKNPPANVRKEIAEWVQREAQLFEIPGMENESRPESTASFPGSSLAESNSLFHSHSATPRALPSDPLLKANAGEISSAAPLPEIVVPIEPRNSPADQSRVHLPVAYADSSASPKEPQVVKPFNNEALFEPISISEPYQFPTALSRKIRSEKTTPPEGEELSPAPAKTTDKIEIRKTKAIEPIAQAAAAPPPEHSLEISTAKGWIPPALLAAWTQGNRQRKVLLAGSGAACFGVFAFLLILGVAHAGHSSKGPVAGETLQAPAVGAPGASFNDSASQAGANLPPPALSSPVVPRTHRRPVSLLKAIVDGALGRQDDGNAAIDGDQIGVQVWTSKSNGYYYCTDSDYYKAVQPGSFMAQGDALQSGYRPKLGRYCD